MEFLKKHIPEGQFTLAENGQIALTANEDREEVSDAAHDVKNQSRYMGLEDIANLASEIEVVAGENHLSLKAKLLIN